MADELTNQVVSYESLVQAMNRLDTSTSNEYYFVWRGRVYTGSSPSECVMAAWREMADELER